MSAAMASPAAAPLAVPPRQPRLPPGLLGLARSVAINFAGPALLYRVVQPWFAPASVGPLLVCTLIPVGDLLAGFARRRRIDAVAVIALVQMSVGIAITLAAPTVRMALTLHALQAAALGCVFAGSALLGTPLIRLLGRQALAGNDPDRQALFDSHAGLPRVRRTFARMTWAWAAALGLESTALVIASRLMQPADYLPLASIVSYGVIGGMTWASLRYGRRRARAQVAADQKA